MNAKQKPHQAHLKEWASRFADQKASGLMIKQWCEENLFSIHTYNVTMHLQPKFFFPYTTSSRHIASNA